MFIEAENVTKQFARRAGDTAGKANAALAGVSVGVQQGKMLALVGPSGSGKTTLLRCIAGLEVPDQGRIRIGERLMFSSDDGVSVPTEQRNLGLIFQSYALWPNMTVHRNVAYPLRRRRVADAQVQERVARYLELVGCAHLAQRYPHELSGGQQQRIALARALVYEPAVVLFDEPLSNLDSMLREHLRAQIRDIQRSVGFTGVYVTHDQGEAFYVGDEVVILREGQVVQAGTPDEIYRQPNSAHVAAFVGASNTIEGRLTEGGHCFEAPDLGRLTLARPRPDLLDAGSVVLMTRPEAVRFSAVQADVQNAAVVTVIERIPSGAADEYTLRLASGKEWRARVDMRTARSEVGAQVALELFADALFFYPGAAAAPKSA